MWACCIAATLWHIDAGEQGPSTSSFRGAGTAREPGTHEHRTSNILEMQVFLGSGLGPSGRPGMTLLGKNNFFTRSKAGIHGAMGTGRSLSSGRPQAGPVGRCGKALGAIRQNCSIRYNVVEPTEKPL